CGLFFYLSGQVQAKGRACQAPKFDMDKPCATVADPRDGAIAQNPRDEHESQFLFLYLRYL
ncbi:MAG: hypothetical protein ABW182_12890, partial [Sphingomonas sp.]